MATTKTRSRGLAGTYGKGAVRAYAGRVVKGVKLLDEKIPGWERKVTLKDLDLADVNCCVMGQVAAKGALADAGYTVRDDHPDYGTGVNALGIVGDEYGFNSDWDIDTRFGLRDEGDDAAAFDILNHLWAEAIRQRRRGHRPSITSLLAAV